MREYHFYVYIMASRSLTLYIGFTSKLQLRVSQHKNGTFEGFSKTYQCHRLVYYQHFQFATNGIKREKQLKRWSRAKANFLWVYSETTTLMAVFPQKKRHCTPDSTSQQQEICSKKIALIKTMNPAWADLSEDWGKLIAPFHEPTISPDERC